MFLRKANRQVVLILVVALIIPVLGPLPGQLGQVKAEQLSADSDGGQALLVTGIIIGAIVWAAGAAHKKSLARHYELGKTLLAQGQYDEAILELEQARKYKDARTLLAQAKERACSLHYDEAKMALAGQNYLSAYRHLKKIIVLDPDYRDVPDLFARAKSWLKPFLTVRVAILDFDINGGYYNLGRQASSGLLNHLVNENLEFVEFIERMELEKLIREQRLWGSGLLDPESIQEMGKVLGVDYLVIGEILGANCNTNTTYTMVTEEDKVRVRYRMEREAHVNVTFRVVNVETGAVVVSDSATERASDVEYSYWRWGFGSLESETELIDEALGRAVHRFGDKLSVFLEKEVSEGIEGSIKAAI